MRARPVDSSHQPEPLLDYGYFGPDSVAWKVFSHPSALSIAFQRTVVSEVFEPFVLAAVADTSAVRNRPEVRYDRTLQYMATIVFGDSKQALDASDVLMRVHSKAVGTEPISGLPYDGNSTAGQLWIHLTAWHSVLLCYETFGPGRLTDAEERRYWAECARAAEFQNINRDEVPRTREEMRSYYERMRPKLALTETGREHVDLLLDGAALLVPATAWARPIRPLARLLFRSATIATLPQWMRSLAGARQPRLADLLTTRLLKLQLAVADQSVTAKRHLVRTVSPRTAPILEPMLLGVAPREQRVLTPAEGRELHGRTDPRDQYQAILAARSAGKLPATPTKDGDAPLLSFTA